MSIQFLAPARDEMLAAVDFYEKQAAIEPDTIVIVAVAHQRRKPDYWKERG